MSRQKRLKRKRKSRFLKVLATLLMMLVAACGYFIYQYQQGMNNAGPAMDQEFEFNGKKNLDKVNVLLLGVDVRPDEEKSRTDTIMVAQYDRKKGTAKLVSIMRDIYTEIPGYRNYKMNTAFYLGGPELLRQTLKKDFDLDIEYYALIDFKGFESVVDTLAPNGIEINVPKKMSANIGVTLKPGLQRLNGKELLGYARFRKDAESDFGRVKRQQEVINALKDEILSTNGAMKLPKLIGTVQPYIQTNLQGADLINLMKDFALHRPDRIETLTIPIDDSYTDVRYENVGMTLDIEFDKNKEAIHSFLDGEAATS
ncbi:LCP family protein [Bacillus sp. PK3_68]|uniref:LCP family protein n=1 Tax=Bacillus sp. PK3_68 TaxID=2027408 RepID=UPI000E719A78|nr:LCP family protein [Bacillus sp. PK3_68]RJS60920.1 transcriptional regulator [Bacillus sp. PK3_68]